MAQKFQVINQNKTFRLLNHFVFHISVIVERCHKTFCRNGTATGAILAYVQCTIVACKFAFAYAHAGLAQTPLFAFRVVTIVGATSNIASFSFEPFVALTGCFGGTKLFLVRQNTFSALATVLRAYGVTAIDTTKPMGAMADSCDAFSPVHASMAARTVFSIPSGLTVALTESSWRTVTVSRALVGALFDFASDPFPAFVAGAALRRANAFPLPTTEVRAAY